MWYQLDRSESIDSVRSRLGEFSLLFFTRLSNSKLNLPFVDLLVQNPAGESRILTLLLHLFFADGASLLSQPISKPWLECGEMVRRRSVSSLHLTDPLFLADLSFFSPSGFVYRFISTVRSHPFILPQRRELISESSFIREPSRRKSSSDKPTSNPSPLASSTTAPKRRNDTSPSTTFESSSSSTRRQSAIPTTTSSANDATRGSRWSRRRLFSTETPVRESRRSYLFRSVRSTSELIASFPSRFPDGITSETRTLELCTTTSCEQNSDSHKSATSVSLSTRRCSRELSLLDLTLSDPSLSVQYISH